MRLHDGLNGERGVRAGGSRQQQPPAWLDPDLGNLCRDRGGLSLRLMIDPLGSSLVDLQHAPCQVSSVPPKPLPRAFQQRRPCFERRLQSWIRDAARLFGHRDGMARLLQPTQRDMEASKHMNERGRALAIGRVVQMRNKVLGPSIEDVLGGLGADVTKREPPKADNSRRLPGPGADGFPVACRPTAAACSCSW